MAVNKGFTLIETLVSIVILSMVMFIGTFALKQFDRLLDKEGRPFDTTAKQYIQLFNLVSAVERMSDYFFGSPSSPQLFFKGTESHLEFVSQFDIFQTDALSFFRIEVDRTNGQNTLYMRFLPMDDWLLREDNAPDKNTLRSIKILTGFEKVTFSYLIIDDQSNLLNTGDIANFTEALQWQKNYLGESGYLPLKISIDIDWGDGTRWPMLIDIKSINYAKKAFLRNE